MTAWGQAQTTVIQSRLVNRCPDAPCTPNSLRLADLDALIGSIGRRRQRGARVLHHLCHIVVEERSYDRDPFAHLQVSYGSMARQHRDGATQ